MNNRYFVIWFVMTFTQFSSHWEDKRDEFGRYLGKFLVADTMINKQDFTKGFSTLDSTKAFFNRALILSKEPMKYKKGYQVIREPYLEYPDSSTGLQVRTFNGQ